MLYVTSALAHNIFNKEGLMKITAKSLRMIVTNLLLISRTIGTVIKIRADCHLSSVLGEHVRARWKILPMNVTEQYSCPYMFLDLTSNKAT